MILTGRDAYYLFSLVLLCSAPYLLVSQERLIWRMGLDGSEARVLVRETRGRVNAVDYHYR